MTQEEANALSANMHVFLHQEMGRYVSKICPQGQRYMREAIISSSVFNQGFGLFVKNHGTLQVATGAGIQPVEVHAKSEIVK